MAGAIAMYLVYAAWVFAGDEWHARGRPRLQPDLGWGDLRAILLQKWVWASLKGHEGVADPRRY